MGSTPAARALLAVAAAAIAGWVFLVQSASSSFAPKLPTLEVSAPGETFASPPFSPDAAEAPPTPPRPPVDGAAWLHALPGEEEEPALEAEAGELAERAPSLQWDGRPVRVAADLQRVVDRLTADALAELQRGIACVPAVCQTNPRDLDGDTLPARPGPPKVLLASFPGSGNSWVRSVIEAGSLRFTGSVYMDMDLARAGMEGELWSASDPRTRVVKSHFPFFNRSKDAGPSGGVGAALVVIRAPFDALYAEAQRRATRNHTGQASAEEVRHKLHIFVHRRGLPSRWSDFMAFWHGGAPIRTSPAGGSAGASMRALHVLGTGGPELGGGPVGILAYEDLTRDFVRTAAALFAFLLAFHGRADARVDSVADAVVCALRAVDRARAVRRGRGPGATNPFAAQALAEESARICRDVARFWDEGRWGACDGTLQRDRSGVRTASPPPVDALPFC